jgi:hypothetical protein
MKNLNETPEWVERADGLLSLFDSIKSRHWYGLLICLISSFMTLMYLGYRPEDELEKSFINWDWLSTEVLWIINISAGAIGGIMLGYPRWIEGAFSGIIAIVFITLTHFLCLDSRSEVYSFELGIPSFVGVIGFVMFYFLTPKKGPDYC